MDGRSKAELQVQNGTRAAVELLNDLRLYYGYDKIVVKTPIVESKLRSGQPPARPLVIAYDVRNIVTIQLTLPTGYPSRDGIDAQLQLVNSTNSNDLAISPALQEACSEATTRILDAKELLSSLISEVESSLQLQDQGVAVEETGGQVPSSNNNNDGVLDDIMDTTTYFYHCRRCRYLLFTSLDLHEHSQGNDENDQCTSLFLEEAPGYVATSELDGGKINCPKCGVRVGAWSWVGTTCSCKLWLAPAFQVTKSKLDRKV
ncbi:hypothetical protein EON65_32920 [archaeon]|nr:MAG: hypothetical protein EON65_32920 [archaeon]